MIINIQPANKINERLLRQELQAIQDNAKIQINQSMNWNRYPYNDNLPCPPHILPPADPTLPWTSPFWVEIVNGDISNRELFEKVIESHDPEMTDFEEKQYLENQKRAQELLESLLGLPDEYLLKIKQKFDSLE